MPGRKLSTSTSARATSSRASATPSGSARSSATRALPAVEAEVVGRALLDVRAAPSGACRRRCSGRSILTTSAPRSASVIVASGPARTREKSATIRPSRGPGATTAGQRTLGALTTLVVSDLHLGSSTAADVLRRDRRARAAARAPGGRRPAGPARRPPRAAPRPRPRGARGRPARCSPTSRRRSRPARRSSSSPATTTTRSIDPWLVGRGRRGAPEPLGLAEAVSPRKASPLAAAIERALAPASVELSYPGVWLRDDVWATHGHYLDVHATLPTFERLAAGVMSRLVGPVPQPRATPDDYERGARAGLRLDRRCGGARGARPRRGGLRERRAGLPAAQRRRSPPDGRARRRGPVPARDPRHQPPRPRPGERRPARPGAAALRAARDAARR